MNKLINFLPPEIANIEEFKKIMETEDKEFELLEKGQQRILNENFIDTATEYGIKHQEELYRVKASITEDLEFRKLRLRNRKMDKVPFSYKSLEKKLNTLFGEEYVNLKLLSNEYTVLIEIDNLDWNMLNELNKNLRYIIPCNMVVNITDISRSVIKIKSKFKTGKSDLPICGTFNCGVNNR